MVQDSMNLETVRLRLRARVAADLDAIMALDADPAVRAFIGGPPDPKAHRAELARNIVLGRPEPHASWAIEWRGAPGLLGLCGLSLWEEGSITQIDWRLRRTAWGHGVATEAAGAVLARALGPLGLRAVVALIHPDNTASIRVAEKIGMLPCGGTQYWGTSQILYRAGEAAGVPSMHRF